MADLNFTFGSSGADKLKGDMRGVSDNAVLAAKGARLLADSLERERRAANVSAGASLALAKADKILADAEDELAGRAVLADAALRGQGDAAQKAGRAAAGAAGGFGGLAGSGGMGAAIAAGAVLSPVIATLGVGLGGLGLAALGVAKNQKLMATELAPLKSEFAGFTKALQPEVLAVFGTGIKIAGGLLHDIQPVAAATGKALDGLLGRVDSEFRSGTWQQFFGFMAAQAGPDIKLVGDNFISLMQVLPGLLEALQPVASVLLQVTNAGLGVIGMTEQLVKKTRQAGGGQPTLWDEIKGGVSWVEQHAPQGNKSIGQLAEGWLGMTSAADAAGKATGRAGDAFKGAWPKAQSYAQWVQASAKATTNLATAQNAAVSAQLAYGNDILTSANDAETFRQKLRASAGQIGLHTQAMRDSFGAANTYIGDLARQATTAITSGHGTDAAIGAIRRGLPALDNAKTKNRQYWQEVSTLVNYLHKLELIKFISTPIHVLGSGKWSVTGTSITPGAAHGPQNIGAAPGFAAGGRVPFSTGTPGKDSVLVMTKPGEIFIPPEKGPMLAPALKAAGIPGFAAGGVAGSYGPGAVSGLPRWIGGRINATDTAISQNTAQAILNAMAAAQKSAKAAMANPFAGITGVPSGGKISGSAAAAQAFAKSILWAYGWGQNQFPSLQALWNGESGWRWDAYNPNGGATGIPQALPGSKMASAGADWRTNPATQIRWGLGYIKSVYGSPANAYSRWLGRSPHWYSEGGLVPGFASGGQVGKQGAAWLKAWQSRHGGGFGAAWGPKVLQEQIPEMAAAVQRAKALSGASGLSPGQHRFWAATAKDETRRLAVLHKELTTERAWRTQLGLNELGLDKEIRAAGNLKSLAGPVRGWKAQLGRDKARVTAISKMLGYSDAYIKAHPAPKPGPVLPTITHSYGGDVTGTIAAVLAAALGPFTGAARGGAVFDRGGTLRPGFNGVWNMTGRPESLVPARGGGGADVHVHFHGPVGSQAELERWLTTALRKGAATLGGGDVQRAYGRH